MSKKIWSLLSFLLIASLVLAACAQPETPPPAAPEEPVAPAPVEPTPEPVQPTPEPVQPTPEPAAEPTPTQAPVEAGPTLTIWADETRAPIILALGDAFQAEYGVSINVEQLGFGDIRDQLKVAGPAGEGPDIIIGAHDWLGELVINGLLAPIDLGDKEDQFADAAVQAFIYEGELYGMPYAVENVAFYRNTDLVPDAPATWDEVREIAAQLEADGEVQQGYVLQQGNPYHFFPIQTAFGGYVFGLDEDGNYDPQDVGIDSEGSIAAAEWLEQMVQDGHLQAEVDDDTMNALFEGEQAAMLITGPWYLDRYRDAGIPYEVSSIPAGDAGEGRPFLGVQGFMISAFSDDPVLAEVFLTEFVATEETMRELQIAGGRASAFLPVQETTDDPDLVAFAEAGEEGLPMPAIPEMSAVWTAWGDAITLIFQQQQSADEAFTNAAEQIRTLIAQ
jgi:arabinogalactan oligomer / maltooligosaccharide transport system substrate-binding protein